jgi:hypothetical protein
VSSDYGAPGKQVVPQAKKLKSWDFCATSDFFRKGPHE